MTETKSRLQDALSSALARYNLVMGEPFPAKAVITIDPSSDFVAVTRPITEGLEIIVSCGVVAALDFLWMEAMALSNNLPEGNQLSVGKVNETVDASLVWLILHELHHHHIGHFELIDDAPTLHLIARSMRASKPIKSLPKETWPLVSQCIELQADHDAIDLMLGEHHIADGDEIRMKAVSIAAVMVLIEREDARNSIEHSTHPKAATRIFQMLGHISEMWSHPAHAIAKNSGRNHVEEQHLPTDEDILLFGKEVILPAYWDAISLAEAANAQTVIDDLEASEDFFADIRHAKLGQWDQLKTVGAKEWASLKRTNDILTSQIQERIEHDLSSEE